MAPSSLAAACQSRSHHPGDLPAVVPHTVLPTGTGSLHAVYECPVCGRGWVTCWDARAAGWPVQREEAA